MKTDQLLAYLASSEVGIRYAIDKIFSEQNDFQEVLLDFLRENIEDSQIQDTIVDDNFKILGKVSDKLDLIEHALIWIGKKKLSSILTQYRFNDLKNSFSISRPRPYDHPDLSAVKIDENNLVEMKDFEVKITGEIEKGNTFFRIIQSIPGVSNSMYWTFKHIFNLPDHENIKIRLDPFFVYPRGGYLPPQYKMFVYGKPPDIDKIYLIDEERYVRWMPDDVDESEVKFTDAVWQKRGDQVHFICEEIPKPEFSDFRGSRYFHSIYSLQHESFIHTDGAIRLYEKNDIDRRANEHVRKIDKIGKRAKLFQIDKFINLGQWCNIAASFFVWNDDVFNYFSYN
jgi:hypothetical protein